MFGLLNINKPVGPTSHDIVAGVRKLVGRRKAKVGHAGTLDPFADGVLVVCVGPATRLADYVQQQTKSYRAGITLGAVSDTHDITGAITENRDAEPVGVDDVMRVLGRFVGPIDQVPPAHSAVHVDGHRAYDLARAGHDLDLPARKVNVYRITLEAFDYPNLTIAVDCGAGTYIRSLARDIGDALGAGAYCSSLTRTGIGKFSIADAIAPSDLDPSSDLIEPAAALDALAKVAIGPDDRNRLALGKAVRPANVTQGPTPEVAVTDLSGHLLAIAKPVDTPEGQVLQPTKVFIQPER